MRKIILSIILVILTTTLFGINARCFLAYYDDELHEVETFEVEKDKFIVNSRIVPSYFLRLQDCGTPVTGPQIQVKADYEFFTSSGGLRKRRYELFLESPIDITGIHLVTVQGDSVEMFTVAKVFDLTSGKRKKITFASDYYVPNEQILFFASGKELDTSIRENIGDPRQKYVFDTSGDRPAMMKNFKPPFMSQSGSLKRAEAKLSFTINTDGTTSSVEIIETSHKRWGRLNLRKQNINLPTGLGNQSQKKQSAHRLFAGIENESDLIGVYIS